MTGFQHYSAGANAMPALSRALRAMLRGRVSLAGLAIVGAASIASVSASAEAPASVISFADGPVVSADLPEKPAGAHWIWVTDLPHGEYNRALLYDADSGRRLATVDMGFEAPSILVSKNRNEVYTTAVYYSRAMHGDRSDMVEVYDAKTLTLKREIPIPPKQIRGWPEPTLTGLSEDGNFIFTQFFTPGSSVGITNLAEAKFGSEVQTSGCAYVFPAGDHRFMTLCGDGSVLAVKFDAQGNEVSRKRYPKFFDADNDPVHGSGFRSGNTWYFASHRGQIHAVDVSGPDLKFLPTWAVAEKEGDKTWVPGAYRQSVAIHRAKGLLYLGMLSSDLKPKGAGTDFQGMDGSEIWVFDIATKKRVNRFKTESPIAYLSVSQDDNPVVYTTDIWSRKVAVYRADTGAKASEINLQFVNALTLQPVD